MTRTSQKSELGNASGSASRRRFLRYGLGGLVVLLAVGFAGFELMDRGALPGKSELDRLAAAP